MGTPKSDLALAAVPLFPLPNVVLFPRAVLPLHIFEDRYKVMTADVLAGDRLVAMALLKRGWEKNYYQKPAIEPVVCVGEILSWEKLPDGKYNYLLQGLLRAQIVREYGNKPYRLAELTPLREMHALEIDLGEARERLRDLFEMGKASRLPVARQFRSLLSSSMSTADIADLAAFNLLEETEIKQALLRECDVRVRLDRLLTALEEWAAHVNPGLYGFPSDPGSN